MADGDPGGVSAWGRSHDRSYRLASDFCSVLLDLRNEFSGDIDSFLVYLIVCLNDLDRSRTHGPGPGVSALSIAEITGIPRETVRRKIRPLVDSGLLIRSAHSHYHIAITAQSAKIIERLHRLMPASTGDGLR